MNYKDVAVKKPWGFENLFYENSSVGIWYLHINPSQQTSFHAHPNKKTGLIVLAGLAEVSFMNGKHILGANDKVNIRNNVFHKTRCISEQPLQLLEIETPNNKQDIIRLEDDYGRAGTAYEDDKHFYRDSERYRLQKNLIIGNVLISWLNLTPAELLDREESKLMILSGKVSYNNYPILSAGDIVDQRTMTRFCEKFTASNIEALELKCC